MTEPSFIARLCAAVTSCDGGEKATRRLIGRAIADTLAVAAAGFSEPVTRASLAAYGGSACASWSGEGCESRDAAVFVNAVASHALDFDDVLLDSTIHASTVILPAILDAENPAHPDTLIAAFGAGLVAARAIGRFVGHGHYHKGWHATGTFGTLVATAAASRRLGLDTERTRAAFALAAAQAGGLKLNFGTMGKPCHAGFAASAGLRAARLALAGVDGSPDIFGGRIGFAALYGTGDGENEPDEDAFALRPDRISVKLFPCCTAAFRLIGIALDARAALGADVFARGTRATLRAPSGSLEMLGEDNPRTPLAAKFSAKYCLAAALAFGAPTLATFTDAALASRALPDLLDRVTILEDPTQRSGGDIEMGTVTLELADPVRGHLGTFERRFIPGGPDAPPLPADLAVKISDCLDSFRQATGRGFAPAERLRHDPLIGAWLAGS